MVERVQQWKLDNPERVRAAQDRRNAKRRSAEGRAKRREENRRRRRRLGMKEREKLTPEERLERKRESGRKASRRWRERHPDEARERKRAWYATPKGRRSKRRTERRRTTRLTCVGCGTLFAPPVYYRYGDGPVRVARIVWNARICSRRCPGRSGHGWFTGREERAIEELARAAVAIGSWSKWVGVKLRARVHAVLERVGWGADIGISWFQPLAPVRHEALVRVVLDRARGIERAEKKKAQGQREGARTPGATTRGGARDGARPFTGGDRKEA